MLEAARCCYKLSNDVVLRATEKPEHFWVFNTSEGTQYSLNATGYWILRQIEEGNNAKMKLLQAFLATFEVQRVQGQADFEEIINLFLKERIITKGGLK